MATPSARSSSRPPADSTTWSAWSRARTSAITTTTDTIIRSGREPWARPISHTVSYGGGQVRLDEQGFVLPSAFQSATLTDIILLGYGNVPRRRTLPRRRHRRHLERPGPGQHQLARQRQPPDLRDGSNFPAGGSTVQANATVSISGRPDNRRSGRAHGRDPATPEHRRQPPGQYDQCRRVQRPGFRGSGRLRHQQSPRSISGSCRRTWATPPPGSPRTSSTAPSRSRMTPMSNW